MNKPFLSKNFLIIVGVLVLIAAIVIAWKGISTISTAEDAPPLAVREPNFEYYGWFAVDYTEPTKAMERMRTYTNTAFATIPLQVKIMNLPRAYARGFMPIELCSPRLRVERLHPTSLRSGIYLRS